MSLGYVSALAIPMNEKMWKAFLTFWLFSYVKDDILIWIIFSSNTPNFRLFFDWLYWNAMVYMPLCSFQ